MTNHQISWKSTQIFLNLWENTGPTAEGNLPKDSICEVDDELQVEPAGKDRK